MLQDDEIEQDSDDRKRKKQYGGGVWLLQAHHAKHQQLKDYCRDNHPTKDETKINATVRGHHLSEVHDFKFSVLSLS